MIARGKMSLDGLDGSTKVAPTPAALDWDAVLRMSNGWYDRLAAAAREPTRAQRARASTEIFADLKNQATAAASWQSLVGAVLGNPRPQVSKIVGLRMMALVLPAVDVCMGAEDRGNMSLNVTKLAFALAEYRARHGSYPAKLADLVPKHVAAIPKDVFSGGELLYKPEGDGYLLYSVGPNGKDDGGRNQNDDPDNEKLQGCDNIAVRIALEIEVVSVAESLLSPFAPRKWRQFFAGAKSPRNTVPQI